MAEESLQSKTEAPTQRRREEARQQGRVAYSAELSAGLLLLGAVAALWLVAPAMGAGLLENLRTDLRSVRPLEMTSEQAALIITGVLGRGLELVGIFLGLLFAVALASGVLQAGLTVAPQMLGPRWEKLSPAEGWSRVFSLTSAVRGFVSVVKVAVIALIAFWVLKGRGPHIAALGMSPLATAAAQGWDLVLRVALAIAAALLVVGLADFAYQRWHFEMSLWMTRQEMKEEVKREEADPLMKARLRKLQREVARRRMFHDVPRATVVLTNPTHLAVALCYERGRMPAPRVVAKGAGFVAEKITALARQHAVPVLERKPIAQALYKTVAVGQDIPTNLYQVIAEVLAFVYRLRTAA